MTSAEYPRVTKIISPLQDFSGIAPDVLAYAAERGSLVHQVINMEFWGELDTDALDPVLQPYYNAWRGFLRESTFCVLESEHPIVHPGFKYRGTLDLIGALDGKKVLMDIKTRAFNPKYDPIQTAAYMAAYNLGKPVKEHVKTRRILSLTTAKNRAGETCGNFKLSPELKNPNDFRIFLACLSIHNWKGC